MGERGPAPKRKSQLKGHVSKESRDSVAVVPGAAPEQPPLDIEGCHSLAASVYAALAESPESRFFTPAVWERARVSTWALSNLLQSARPSSQMYAAIQADWKSLLIDPAEQRRLGIEVQSAPVDVEAASADGVVTSLMDRLGG